jgi:hypothetical protein
VLSEQARRLSGYHLVSVSNIERMA